MRILFSHDIFMRQQYGGVSRYCANLHRSLLDGGEDSTIVAGAYQAAYISRLPRVVGLKLPIARPRRLVQRIAATVGAACERRFLARAGGGAILHKTYYSPFVRIPAQIRKVMTLYDVIDEMDNLRERQHIRDDKRQCCRTADLIIAISEKTRSDAVEVLQVPRERIHVTPLAVGPEVIGNHRKKDGRPYVLFVGDRASLHKNFNTFATAYAQSRASRHSTLVLFGGGSLTPAERGLFRRLGIQGRIRPISGDDSVMGDAYANAAVFVCPSRYEGFGLPVLEAMANGCTTVCSRAGALPEVAGSAAIYFDPADVDDISEGIDAAFFDVELSKKMRSLGTSRAAQFSWAETSAATLAAYKTLL